MKIHYRAILIGISAVVMAGCHTFGSENLFAPHLSDEAITTLAYQTLMDNPNLSNVPIQVETRQGNIFLSGYVKTIRQSDTAGDLVSHVSGVKSVQNNLIVRK